MPHPGCVNRTRLKRARSDIPPSTAEDDPRAAQCAHSKTHGVPRGTLSIHFDTRCALGRSRCALVRARSPRDRSRSSLTREQSITRLAQCPSAARRRSSIERSQLFVRFGVLTNARGRRLGPPLALATGRCASASAARSTLSRAGSALRRSRSAHAQTEDTCCEARTAPVVLLSSFSQQRARACHPERSERHARGAMDLL